MLKDSIETVLAYYFIILGFMMLLIFGCMLIELPDFIKKVKSKKQKGGGQ